MKDYWFRQIVGGVVGVAWGVAVDPEDVAFGGAGAVEAEPGGALGVLGAGAASVGGGVADGGGAVAVVALGVVLVAGEAADAGDASGGESVVVTVGVGGAGAAFIGRATDAGLGGGALVVAQTADAGEGVLVADEALAADAAGPRVPAGHVAGHRAIGRDTGAIREMGARGTRQVIVAAGDEGEDPDGYRKPSHQVGDPQYITSPHSRLAGHSSATLHA